MISSHGPSRVEIAGNVVCKHFPATESERLRHEVDKLQQLRTISASCGLFSVPLVLEVKELSYTMSRIDAAPIGRITSSAVPRLLQVVAAVARSGTIRATQLDLWAVMLEKFKLAPTTDQEYIQLVDNLPQPAQLTLGYSHGDLTCDNILVDTADRWWLIDPAWSAVESPLWDVGKILQSTAVNWENIKQTGHAGTATSAAAKVNALIVAQLARSFQPAELLLGLACQLARVSRWCFAEELTRISKQLLLVYTEGNADECLDALCRIK